MNSGPLSERMYQRSPRAKIQQPLAALYQDTKALALPFAISNPSGRQITGQTLHTLTIWRKSETLAIFPSTRYPVG